MHLHYKYDFSFEWDWMHKIACHLTLFLNSYIGTGQTPLWSFMPVVHRMPAVLTLQSLAARCVTDFFSQQLHMSGSKYNLLDTHK